MHFAVAFATNNTFS